MERSNSIKRTQDSMGQTIGIIVQNIMSNLSKDSPSVGSSNSVKRRQDSNVQRIGSIMQDIVRGLSQHIPVPVQVVEGR